MKTDRYDPQPIDTSDVVVSDEIAALSEKLAENTHDVWARGRLDEGWTYGKTLDRDKKTHPLLVPYGELTESARNAQSAAKVRVRHRAQRLNGPQTFPQKGRDHERAK